jgi:hypothetical protein
MKLTAQRLKQLIKEEIRKQKLNERIRGYNYRITLKWKSGSELQIPYYVFLRKKKETSVDFKARCKDSVDPTGESATKVADFSTKSNPVGHFLVEDSPAILYKRIYKKEKEINKVKDYPKSKENKLPVYGDDYCYAVGVFTPDAATLLRPYVVGLGL